jgi:hypothetical protein
MGFGRALYIFNEKTLIAQNGIVHDRRSNCTGNPSTVFNQAVMVRAESLLALNLGRGVVENHQQTCETTSKLYTWFEFKTCSDKTHNQKR